MKKIILLTAVAMSSFLVQQANAQVRVRVNLNLAHQPVWGPVGYDEAQYYYLPDIDSYYDVNRSQFIYYSGNRWIYASRLPARYSGFDLYNGYKVVVNEPRPYMHADLYRAKYRNNRAPRERQVIIRDSREEKYYQVRGHPMHNEWQKNHHDDHHGNGRGRDENRRKHD